MRKLLEASLNNLILHNQEFHDGKKCISPNFASIQNEASNFVSINKELPSKTEDFRD